MKNLKRFLSLFLAMVMVLSLVVIPTSAADATVITKDTVWNDGDVIGPVTIIGGTKSDPITITVNGTVTVNGQITLDSVDMCNVVFKGDGTLIRGAGNVGGAVVWIQGNNRIWHNVTFDGVTLDGGAVWGGTTHDILCRGTTNEGIKATGSNASILFVRYAEVTLKNAVLQNQDNSNAKGCAINVGYGRVNIEDSIVRNNFHRGDRGGAIHMRNGAAVYGEDSEFYGNHADEGAVLGTSGNSAYASVMVFDNCSFTNNYSNGSGAVFHLQNNIFPTNGTSTYRYYGDLRVSNSTFSGNGCATKGKGLIHSSAYETPAYLDNCTIENNDCNLFGYTSTNKNLYVDNCNILYDGSESLAAAPLQITGPVGDMALSKTTVSYLMNKFGYVANEAEGYAITAEDVAKMLGEDAVYTLADANGDGKLDVIAKELTETISVTVKDGENESVQNVFVGTFPYLAAPAGLYLDRWVDAEQVNISGAGAIADGAVLSPMWAVERPMGITTKVSDTAVLGDAEYTISIDKIANYSDDIDYTYKWYFDESVISGADGPSLTTSGVAYGMHHYTCMITANKEGCYPSKTEYSVSATAPILVNAEAKIGRVKYMTLEEAVAVANEDTETEGAVVIDLLADIDFDQKMTISRDIVIQGDYTLTRADYYTGGLFGVDAGVTFTLKDLTIDGNNNWTFLEDEFRADAENGIRTGNGNCDYVVEESGAPVATGTLITIGNTATEDGTFVGGSVTLDGATVKNHVGCTLFYVPNAATLTMNGATIKHNTKTGTPVVASVNGGGTWFINNGTVICDNHTNPGNGVLSYMCGTTIMNGGEIYGNTGVDCNGSVMMLYGGSASFTMNGGRIYDNGATYGSNNGWNCAFYVYGNGAKFTMNGGVIEGNYSESIPGIASNGSNALITLNGGKIINTVSGRGFTARDVYSYCPVNISEVVDSATNGFYNNVTNVGTLNGNSWFYTNAMTYSGGGTFNGNVTVQSGAETTMVDGKWINGLVLVSAVGNDTTLTVQKDATIDGVQVRVLDSVESGDYLNYEEAKAAQAASYVEEDGANVISPVLFYHRLTSAQKKNIVVTFDYNGGLDAQGWSGCQLTSDAESFVPVTPTPTKGDLVLMGWKYAADNNPECLTMETTDDYNGEAITTSLRLIAVYGKYVPPTVNVGVSKVWDDADNRDGLRPASVTVSLLANGTATGETLTLNEGSNWAGEFAELLKFDESGKEIVYTVAEKAVTGYTAAITGDAATGFVITNSHAPETVKVAVSKTWSDDNNRDGIRPASVTVNLLANGKATDKTLTLSESNGWKGQFTELSKYENGKAITYTVSENAITGYTAAISGSAATGFTVTNTHTPERVTVKVTKKWVDESNKNSTRPSEITVNLMANGTKKSSIKLNSSNSWKGEFANLYKYENGKAITYTVDESAVPTGYKKTISGEDNAFTITNTLGTAKLKVTKKVTGSTVPTQQGTYQFKVTTGTGSSLKALPVGTTYKVGSTTKTVTTAGIIELKKDQTAEITLLAGTSYKVVEQVNTDYSYRVSYKNQTGTIALSDSPSNITCTVTNEYIVPDAAVVLTVDMSGTMYRYKMDSKRYVDVAKAKALEFVNDYAKSYYHEDDKRMLAIVSFDTDAKVVLNWVDVNTADGLAAAKTAINGMKVRDNGSTSSNNVCTNFDGGIILARNMLKQSALKNIDKKFAIILSDGAPTVTVNSDTSTVGTIKSSFWGDQKDAAGKVYQKKHYGGGWTHPGEVDRTLTYMKGLADQTVNYKDGSGTTEGIFIVGVGGDMSVKLFYDAVKGTSNGTRTSDVKNKTGAFNHIDALSGKTASQIMKMTTGDWMKLLATKVDGTYATAKDTAALKTGFTNIISVIKDVTNP